MSRSYIGRVGSYQKRPALLLDDRRLRDAIGAYSLRKLRTAYNGPCIRVRRAVDNVELDIGFDNTGWIDQAALLAHCGAQNGQVSVSYDQGLRGAHQTQSILARQLRIVTSSAVELTGVGGRPCMRNAAATAAGYVGPVLTPGYTGKGASSAVVARIPSGGTFCRLASFVKDAAADNSGATVGAMCIQNSTNAQAGIFRVGAVCYNAMTLDTLMTFASRTSGTNAIALNSQSITRVAATLAWDINRMTVGVIDGGNATAGIAINALLCENIGWWRDVAPSAMAFVQADQRAAWGAV
jgi:hypothetical protein